MNIQTVVAMSSLTIAMSNNGNSINISTKDGYFSVYFDKGIIKIDAKEKDIPNIAITKEKIGNGEIGYIIRYKEKNIIEVTI